MKKNYETADFEGQSWDEKLSLEENVRQLLEAGIIEDVGPPPSRNRPVRSPSGGLNSKISGRWDLLDTDALTRLTAVLEYGTTKYSEDNWRLDPVELHLNHALEHLFKYLKDRREGNGSRVPYTKDGSEDELGHAFCRVMFALAVEFQDEAYFELVKLHNGVR